MLTWIKTHRFTWLTFLIGVVLGTFIEWPYKELVKGVYFRDYAEHVFECDNAMRTHFIAKAQLTDNPSESQVQSLRSAEVGLVSCHEYDKFRKKLISLGLTENDLSQMGLMAIEESRSALSILVREHEIRY